MLAGDDQTDVAVADAWANGVKDMLFRRTIQQSTMPAEALSRCNNRLEQ